jgi:hypothetical protein
MTTLRVWLVDPNPCPRRIRPPRTLLVFYYEEARTVEAVRRAIIELLVTALGIGDQPECHALNLVSCNRDLFRVAPIQAA